MFKKVDNIPEELKALLPQNKKAIVIIGSNAYEMYPIPLPMLPEILNDVLKIYENAKMYVKKQQDKEIKDSFNQLLKELATIKSILIGAIQKKELDEIVLEEVTTTLNVLLNGINNILQAMNNLSPIDIIGAPGNHELIMPLIKKVMSGVPDEDFNNMTPQQLVYLVNKAFEINTVAIDELTNKQENKQQETPEVKEQEPFSHTNAESNKESEPNTQA